MITIPDTETAPLASIAYRTRSVGQSSEWLDLVQFEHFLFRRAGARLAHYVFDEPFLRPDTSTDSTYSQTNNRSDGRDLDQTEPANRFRRWMEGPSDPEGTELEVRIFGENADVRVTPHVRQNDSDTALTSFAVQNSGSADWAHAFQRYDETDLQNKGDLSNIYVEVEARSTSSTDNAGIFHIEVRGSIISDPSILKDVNISNSSILT